MQGTLYLPKFITSKTFKDLSLATEQNRRPSTLAAVQHIDPVKICKIVHKNLRNVPNKQTKQNQYFLNPDSVGFTHYPNDF